MDMVLVLVVILIYSFMFVWCGILCLWYVIVLWDNDLWVVVLMLEGLRV